MTLHIHRADRLEQLIAALAALPHPPDPFQAETFAVPTRPLGRWLGTALARHRGIFAHAELTDLDTLLRSLTISSERPDPWSPERLTGHIAALFDAPLPPSALTRYLAFHPASHVNPPRLELARRIATSFSRYALHRPELVASWDAGMDDPDGWQAHLWRLLVSRLGPHPGALLPIEPSLPFDRLVVFGYTTLPPLQIQALERLSNHLDIHLMFVCPHAADTEPHPITASLGRLVVDFEHLLAPLRATRHLHTARVTPTTRLGHLQQALHAPPSHSAPTPLDDSLQFHACGHELRQAEVLRDALLDLFDRHEDLEPRDIAILVPDLEFWTPFIDTAFRATGTSTAAAALSHLYSASVRQKNPVVSALLAVLDLLDSRFERDAVLDVMRLPALRAAMGLEESDLEHIAERLSDLVRWGIDADHREACHQPRVDLHTWRSAFDRLLLGHAIPNRDGTTLVSSLSPLDDVEGKELEPLGRFIAHSNLVFGLAESLSPRSSSRWRETLMPFVESLLIFDEPSRSLAQPIFDALFALANRLPETLALDLRAYSNLLSHEFDTDLRPEPLSGLTIAQLAPMRLPPFKVVALLGMDAHRFPRRTRHAGFDLLETTQTASDRSSRDDDREALLEAFCSARNHFIATWNGHRPGETRPVDPTPPLEELIAWAERDAGESLITRHPTHPFNPSIFETSSPNSFDIVHLATARRLREPRVAPTPRTPPPPPAQPTLRDLSLTELISSITHPARAFCRTRLGLDLTSFSASPPRRESVVFDGLETWRARDRLLEWRLSGQSEASCERLLEASHLLPLGRSGDILRAELLRETDLLVRQWQALHPKASPLEAVRVELSPGGLTVRGRLERVRRDTPSGLMRIRAGKRRATDLLELWVEHLALIATLKKCCESHLVTTDLITTFGVIAPRDAREHLFQLTAFAQRVHLRPMPFFPASSLAWFRFARSVRTPNPGPPPKSVESQWARSRGGAERDDPHIDLLFGALREDETFPFENLDFQTISLELLTPLFAHMTERSPEP